MLVNGQEYSFRANASSLLVRLEEGSNTIVVRVSYYDGTQNILASRSYTVRYSPAGQTVIVAYRKQDNTPLSQIHTTAEGGLSFVAYGLRDGRQLRASVRLNGKTIQSATSAFTAALQFGEMCWRSA